jgi:hypothetical protein
MLRNTLLGAALAAGPAAAMEVQVLEDQIIMSGRIDGSELVRLWEIAAERRGPRMRTVVLRDSAGGDLRTSITAGDFIREQGWNTAVSGYCFSGCALIFLGGRQRFFSDDKPPLQTQLGFHGTYYVAAAIGARPGPTPGTLSPWHTAEARRWMKLATDGRITEAMLDRFETLASSDFIHFFDANRLPRAGQVSIFVCPIVKDGKRKCEPIAGTDVYREGIVNSVAVIRSHDRR